LVILIFILSFAIGVGIYRISSPTVSIETISNHTFFYNGMSVHLETYAQLESYDENLWYLGEPFEKKEVWTNLDLEQNSSDLTALHSQLKENLSKQHFKRAKVLVKGIVKDNCIPEVSKGGGVTLGGCCFGRSITIKAQEVIQLEPVKDYALPE
jgi:hypothetical protein